MPRGIRLRANHCATSRAVLHLTDEAIGRNLLPGRLSNREQTIMNELVERLSNGLHPIVAERSGSPRELREQIERGFVLLKFPNTRGGTELGSQLDMDETRLDGADFDSGTGNVHLVGNLTLNYDKVRLVADIDLASLKGTGQLVLVEEETKATGTKVN